MNSAAQVQQITKRLITEGARRAEIVWQTALACVDWPYVFGAWGAHCTPEERQKRYSISHPTIKTKCQNFSGNKTCVGCKWFPECERVRCFDCRGFTDWCLNQVGIDISGEGATSQWNTAYNWQKRGTINEMPADTLVCLFVQKGQKMEHTGLGYNNETVECSSGVQYFGKRNKKWTHYAIPAGIECDVPINTRPILRKGDKGEAVIELQRLLIERGYNVGKTGADGKFGKNTEAAVKAFQQSAGIAVDGVCGPATWDALAMPIVYYIATIPGLTRYQAEELLKQYPNAVIQEGG